MKDYYQMNESILNEWEQAFNANYKGKAPDFCKDGLMNMGVYVDNNQCQNAGEYWPTGWARKASGNESELWSKAPLRILYLTKDLNGGEGGSGWDVRFESLYKAGIDDEILRKDSIFKLIAYTLYGLTQSTVDKVVSYQELENMSHTEILPVVNACAFARINVKKEVGASSVTDDSITEEMEKYHKYLIRQITALEPDIIVCCGNRNDRNVIIDFLNKYYYCFESTKEGSSIHYDKTFGVVAIDSYHFAARKGDETMYNDVVVRFMEFLKLNKGIFPIR